jgi:hypothetical protein
MYSHKFLLVMLMFLDKLMSTLTVSCGAVHPPKKEMEKMFLVMLNKDIVLWEIIPSFPP